MAEEKEKSYEELLHEAQEEREALSKDVETLEQRKYLIEGIALGLFSGIIGNIFVSHYYGFFERWTTRNFDDFFIKNLFALVLALFVVIVVSFLWYER